MKLFTAVIASILVSINVAHGVEINGVGSYMPQKIMNAWSNRYHIRHKDVTINYKTTSTRDGIDAVAEGRADFGIIDQALKKEELQKYGIVQFPIVLTGASIPLNIPRVYLGQVKLDPQTLADIFCGNITRWNDKRIVALNPEIQLPNHEIITIHRQTPKGVNTIIGNFLSEHSKSFEEKIGRDLNGQWPENAMVVKNADEMAEAIKNTEYSIGHLEISSMIQAKLAFAKIKNKDGYFVSPGHENLISAANNVVWKDNKYFTEILSNRGGEKTWPLTLSSYILMKKKQDDVEKANSLLKFIKYSLEYGDFDVLMHSYAPLPKTIALNVVMSWDYLFDHVNGQYLWNNSSSNIVLSEASKETQFNIVNYK